jgi:hypothetical protein
LKSSQRSSPPGDEFCLADPMSKKRKWLKEEEQTKNEEQQYEKNKSDIR